MLILVAGDGFIAPAMLADVIGSRVTADNVKFRQLTLPWPGVPFSPVAEVQEASGTQEELIDALSGVQIAVTQMAPFTRRVIESAPQLKLIVVCRGGPINVNRKAADEFGVAVRSTPGRNATAAAEHTLALMLAAMRRIPQMHTSMAAGQWRGDHYSYRACAEELGDATIGLVGYGAIGRIVARILAAFGARILVHDPYAEPDDVTEGQLASLDDLLATSSVISLHARLTAETQNLIGSDQIALMQPGTVLVNTARGGLVDYPAVVDALHAGHLGAAAFDVYDPEPPAPDDPIRSAPRVVLTPHLGGATKQTAHRAAQLSAAEVENFLQAERAVPGSGHQAGLTSTGR